MKRLRLRAFIGAGALTLALAGCSAEDTPDVEPTERPSTSAPTPTRTASPSPTPTPTLMFGGLGPNGVDVTRPPAGVPATGPAVVLVHGGFWLAGEPEDMDAWAQALAGAGAVVFNASYRLVGAPGGGYPGSVDDIACAVRYARAEASRFTASDELVIMGHSAGGHLAAVVALNGDEFGADCPYPVAAPPDRLIGLAGVYDVRGLGLLFNGFVGASRAAAPEQWTSVNPIELADRRDDLTVRLVVAGSDEIIPPASADDFAAALPSTDRVSVQVVRGAGHAELLQPDTVELSTLQLF